MTDKTDPMMLIGLHKLAAERGDGLIPELLALYAAHDAVMADNHHMAKTRPDEAPTAAGNDNVIPFRPYLVAKRKRG